ncbi:hypothetical protein BDY19DRAFT_942057, partial [Irpex rosettiformis]
TVTDQETDKSQRIQAHHRHLHSLAGNLQASSWAMRAMHQIEALKFANVWNACTQSVKRVFYEEAFYQQGHIQAQIINLSSKDKKAMLQKHGEFKEEFRKWKRTNERVAI